MLEVKNISVKIKNETILKNISFLYDFKDPFLIITGDSGVGKSTLMNVLLGSQIPSSGQIILNGKDITKYKIIDRHIGIVYQDFMLFPHLTVIENINIGKNIDKILRNILIKQFGLTNLLYKLPNEISGGEIQRVALIRTLITKPKLLLLDEVFSNLDIINKEKIIKILIDILPKLNIPTIIITHNRKDIELLSVNKGKLKEIHLIK